MSLIIKAPGAFIAGATYPLRALFTFIKHPKLRQYIVAPILLNIFLGITLYAGLLYGGLNLINLIIADIPHWTASLPHWTPDLPDWTLPTWMIPHWTLPAWSLPHWTLPGWHLSLPHWLEPVLNWRPSLPNWFAEVPSWLAIALIWVLRFILTVLLFIATGFIMLQFGVLLGAPWYGKLSEELERLQTGQVKVIEVGLANDIGRAVLYELKKLVLSLGVGLPLLAFNFFPGVGTAIASLGGIALTAIIVCLDFLDAALERRRLRFRQKLGLFWRSLPASASFAMVCLGLVSIPLINLVAIPICVAAGTLFFCDRIYPWFEGNQQKGPEKLG